MIARRAFLAFAAGLVARPSMAQPPVTVINPAPRLCPFDGGNLIEQGQFVYAKATGPQTATYVIDPIYAVAVCDKCGLISRVRQGAQ